MNPKDLLEGKPLRHPIHPMLVHFPIGLFVLSFLLDLGSVFFGVPNLPRASYYAMLLAEIMALVTAVPGFVDYTDIRADHPAKPTATTHMVLNLIAVAVYGINLGVRAGGLDQPRISIGGLILSLIGIGLISISGYLGGALIYADGIAVGRHKRATATPEETLKPIAAGAQTRPDLIFVAVPRAENLRDGETLRVEANGYVIAVARVESQLFAFQEFCTHRYGPLSEGSFHGFNVQCPWHNSCFDVRTGKVTNGPAKVDLKTFQIENRDGRIFIGLPRPIERS
jgi:uncharacterized membrane protein/nitrite reductase/ring-hydroxylating ferredoxin subunit